MRFVFSIKSNYGDERVNGEGVLVFSNIKKHCSISIPENIRTKLETLIVSSH